jgi:hypothetical protein
MRNRQVPRSEWFRFLDDFSRRHGGSLTTVRILHPDFGSQVEARGLPLGGIVSPASASGPISIHVGSATTSHVEHEIPDPKQVWVELSESGSEEALGFVSEDGTTTIVDVHTAGSPA